MSGSCELDDGSLAQALRGVGITLIEWRRWIRVAFYTTPVSTVTRWLSSSVFYDTSASTRRSDRQIPFLYRFYWCRSGMSNHVVKARFDAHASSFVSAPSARFCLLFARPSARNRFRVQSFYGFSSTRLSS